MTTTDCLICLLPIRGNPWSPPIACRCRPFLHKTCWNTWIEHNGHPSCVICRWPSRPEELIPPIRRHLPADNIAALFGTLFLVWFVLVLTFSQRVEVYLPVQQRRPYNIRDEL